MRIMKSKFQKVCLLIAILIASSVCLNVAMFTGVSVAVKVICGISGILFYLSLFVIVYLLERSKGYKHNLFVYVKERFCNIISEE